MEHEKIAAKYGRKTIVTLVMRGILVGIFSGAVVVLYRWLLGNAESFLFQITDAVKGSPLKTLLWLLALGVIGVIVSLIVKLEPMAAGSGIPQVACEANGRLSPVWWRVILFKLVGGTLCVFSGLSLGREGPSVQFGGMAAKGAAKLTKADGQTARTMLVCGAGAGLAAAFNAPFAGILFVLEEIIHKFDRATLCMGFVAAVTADFISKIFFGQAPVFSYKAVTLPLRYYWLLIVLGVILGLFGVVYNFLMSKGQDIFKSISEKIPKQISFPIIFVLSGVIGIFLPDILASGHKMVDILANEAPQIGMLILLLGAKFLFGVLSHSTGAPGGSLQPLLVLGTYAGAVFGMAATNLFSLNPDSWQLFAQLAMAGLFASIVRSPLTAVILVFETTGNMSNLLPLIIVTLISYVVADFFKSEPFYETLINKMISGQGNSN